MVCLGDSVHGLDGFHGSARKKSFKNLPALYRRHTCVIRVRLPITNHQLENSTFSCLVV